MLPFVIKRVGDSSEDQSKWQQILDSLSSSMYKNILFKHSMETLANGKATKDFLRMHFKLQRFQPLE